MKLEGCVLGGETTWQLLAKFGHALVSNKWLFSSLFMLVHDLLKDLWE